MLFTLVVCVAILVVKVVLIEHVLSTTHWNQSPTVAVLRGAVVKHWIDETEIGSEKAVFIVQTFVSINEEVLGISESKMLEGASPIAMLDAWMESYQTARANKDFALVDTIRANFKANQIIIKDSKEGSEWAYEE